ncbi:MAG: RNA methyltransferase [Amoebophilaceae bacterium]|jgi:tRNA G18 (ribose-2'-O)-methylase SpoU|nr:RNA methyltransferase [Amoebophilaceae bacterium]
MKKLKIYELPRLSPETFRAKKKTPLVIVLDNVRSMHNVGAAFRIADAFLIEKLYLCGITATPPHREIHKTALGAEEHVAWEQTQDTLSVIKHLKIAGYLIVAVEQTDASRALHVFEHSTTQKCAVIFGHEVFGIQESVLSACDLCLEIPQHGVKHSLNVSVSMGIVVWELVGKSR